MPTTNSGAEARGKLIQEWLFASHALRNLSDSALAYADHLKSTGEKAEILIVPNVTGHVPTANEEKKSRKRKADDDDEDRPKKGKGSRGGKKAKDPNAPKRPASAYILFQNSIRTQMREDNKDIPYTEVMKKIGDAWNNLPGDEKEKWNAQANEAMAKYKELEADYKAAGGKISTPSVHGSEDEVAPAVKVKSKKETKEVKEKNKGAPAPAEATTEEESSDEEEAPPAAAPVPKKQKVATSSDEESDESESEEEPAPAPAAKKAKSTPAVVAPSSKAAKVSTSKPAEKVKVKETAPSSKPAKADKKHKATSPEKEVKEQKKKRKSMAAE